MPTVPVPMEEVKRINIVMTCPNQRVVFALLSYASPLVQKSHLHRDIIPQLYKPAFYGGHLLATFLTAVVHSSEYSVFHDRGTSNRLGFLW